MVVVALIAIGMVLLITCAVLWPEPEDDKPSSPEGALTRRLLAGEIDQRQYRSELARIARRR